MEFFVCLECATVNDTKGETLTCAKCKTEFDADNYKKVLLHAADACRYGYDYRKYYEEQLLERGQINRMPSLVEPTNIFEFLAAAAIGGFAWDAVKTCGTYLVEFVLRKATMSKRDIEFLELMSDDKKLKKFVKYVRAYSKDFTTASEDVKKAIAEEMHADVAGQYGARMTDAARSRNRQAIHDVFQQINKSLKEKKAEQSNYPALKKAAKKLRRELK
ncbi:hypothetical protein [Parachryseolinea silvisoli]|uniref:hypothetical protein n=1 Tax=Parachryseolinea silvisoli TaxID=2873601 RepID=UPI002265E0A5|nr:hypothetical protein [Parachryseolinea silvisoli]MCD9015241.1 hypothetical protein [Parachryseolinea silvisoli]